MTIPLNLFQLIVVVFIAIPSVCVIMTLTADRLYNRHHHRWLKRQKAVLDLRKKLLDERYRLLRIREEQVVEREQGLRRRAKEAGAMLHAEEEAIDTLISVLDIDDIPHPNDTSDTIAIPAFREEQ
jgi:hypothetical protein